MLRAPRLEEVLAKCPKYEPGSDVSNYLLETLWGACAFETLDLVELGLSRVLSVTGLDQHPAFKDLDRVEFTIRCCGGDPDEVCLLDFTSASRRLGVDLHSNFSSIDSESLFRSAPGVVRAIYILLEPHMLKRRG